MKDFGWVEIKGDSVEHKIDWKKLNSLKAKTVHLEF